MTLTKALAELKLLSKRIESKLKDLKPIAIKKGNKFEAAIKCQRDFERDARASWQSMFDLMARRRRIKTALVMANANTRLTINGETMTIADAIERKSMLDLERRICTEMRNKLNDVENAVDRHNAELNDKLVALLHSTYARRESQLSRDEYDRIAKPFFESNEAKLVDPLNLRRTLDAMEDNYEKFLSEVDVCLSVANASTIIHVHTDY